MAFRINAKWLCRRVDLIYSLVIYFFIYFFTNYTFMSNLRSSSKPDKVKDDVKKLFNEKALVIWNNDLHPSPALDVKQLLEPLGVHFHINILSDYCRFFNICEERKHLKVLNNRNYASVNDTMISSFFDAYKNDPTMQSVDAFLCCDPIFLCELFEPFNRSLIIVAGGRYYLGRGAKTTWKRWNRKLIGLAASSRHVIAANNAYDANIIRYYTGIEPVYLPNYCDYTGATYRPTRPEFLLARRPPDVVSLDWFEQEYDRASAATSVNETGRRRSELVRIDRRYETYGYGDLAAHRGIVHLPYQMSTMSIFEQYRMNVPLFFPSMDLLIRWNAERNVLIKRTESIPRMAPHRRQRHVPSPVNDSDTDAMRHWFRFADYYTLPHVTYFDSIEHLADILGRMTDIDLLSISDRMKRHNAEVKEELMKTWRTVLMNVAKYSGNVPR